ncbi:hypothetical protein [Pseudomonas chlororaphis]|uniref:Uncharacterized protein n=1 Tax=Pseudomonas chlororaphis TaxID=587753 RepID=A0A0D5XTC5_9PSED|nr:hypothetical protein [Pseudomonas chlororaphis]AKA22318.1 hypothetical protein PCL1606_08630 [Pseudomonas chlororaphis]
MTADQKLSAALQGLFAVACSRLRAGYPQAAPQGLGVSRSPFHDRSMKAFIVVSAGGESSASLPDRRPVSWYLPVSGALIRK